MTSARELLYLAILTLGVIFNVLFMLTLTHSFTKKICITEFALFVKPSLIITHKYYLGSEYSYLSLLKVEWYGVSAPLHRLDPTQAFKMACAGIDLPKPIGGRSRWWLASIKGEPHSSDERLLAQHVITKARKIKIDIPHKLSTSQKTNVGGRNSVLHVHFCVVVF